MTYVPRRDHRFDHVTDVIDFVERHSCTLGCKNAIDPTESEPGGNCGLFLLALNEQDVPGWDDQGDDGVLCTARKPLEGS